MVVFKWQKKYDNDSKVKEVRGIRQLVFEQFSKKIRLWSVFLLTILLFLFGLPQVVMAEESSQVNANAAMLIDFDTGQILYQQNSDEKLGIASMTKMMTEYIVLEEMALGNLSWETPVTISDYAGTISIDYRLANVPLRVGEQYSVEELFEAMAIYSANGATIALAEHISGNEATFVERMRDLLDSWGIDGSQIYNSTGLNNADLYGHHIEGSPQDAENLLSARDIATVASHLLNDYPEVLEKTSIPQKPFRPGTPDEMMMVSFNQMLPGLRFERAGVDGLKTGTTFLAGATFTATAVEDDQRLIAIVMNAGDDFDDTSTRFMEIDRLLDYGFGAFQPQAIVNAGDSLPEYASLEVIDGTEDRVNVVLAESSLAYLREEDAIEENIYYEVHWDPELVSEDGAIKAPIHAGDQLGYAVVSWGDPSENYLDTASEDHHIALLAESTVEKASFLEKIWQQIIEVWKFFIGRF